MEIYIQAICENKHLATWPKSIHRGTSALRLSICGAAEQSCTRWIYWWVPLRVSVYVFVCTRVQSPQFSFTLQKSSKKFISCYQRLIFFLFFAFLRLFPAGPALIPWQLSTSEGCWSGSSGHSFHMRLHETGRRDQKVRACSSSGRPPELLYGLERHLRQRLLKYLLKTKNFIG